jgi:teichuronic acid biosynthesis glycosyltransferase TuaG
MERINMRKGKVDPNHCRVSIIIPFYNCPYVDQAVVSALMQTHTNTEVIVIDDGSTMYQELLNPYADRIRWITQANGGTAAALNAGIRASTGDYIAWLSADDTFYPCKVAKQLMFMLKLGASFSFSAFDVIDATGKLTDTHVHYKAITNTKCIRRLIVGNPINGCTVLIRKKLLDQVGLFREDLPFTHDYDLWCRIALSGINLHFLDRSLIQYRKHEGMGTIQHQAHIQAEYAGTNAIYAEALVQLNQHYKNLLKQKKRFS